MNEPTTSNAESAPAVAVQRVVSCREIWNRCDVCGRFISYNAFDCGFAVRKMVTPDSAYSAEDYETLCEQHRDS